jgi:hypothetical protein
MKDLHEDGTLWGQFIRHIELQNVAIGQKSFLVRFSFSGGERTHRSDDSVLSHVQQLF